MSLARYFGKELFLSKIESLTGMKLSTILCWLINEAILEERLEPNNKLKFAIVITVENGIEASQLGSKGLKFGDTRKIVEKYWEAGHLSICMSCTEIRHN